MKKIMYMAVAAIAALSSCSSDEFAGSNGNNGEEKVFTGTIVNDGVSSRSTLVDNTANWESTDKVCINGAVYTVTPQSDATKATFTKDSGDEPTGTYKAFYANGANSGSYWDSSTSSFKLPASYNYAEGKFNMPMYAQSETTSLGFQNICGVLAIKVTSEEMSSVTSITVTSDKAISGACTINGDGTTTKYYATATSTADADKTVTLTCSSAVTPKSESEGGTVFYVPVPVISDATLYVTVNGDVATAKATIYSPFIYTQSMKKTGVTIARNTIYNVEFKTSLAKFSVGASTTVNFTNGNLLSDASGIISFESSQTAYETSWDASKVDHFYWTVKKEDSYCQTYPSSFSPDISTSDTPWFKENVTVGSTEGLRALTGGANGEYKYLINTRTSASSLYKYGVTVGSATNCLIIAPDNFVGTLKSSYTDENELKASGLVCLPAAGNRDGSGIYSGGSNGYYWSATPYESGKSYAYYLYFSDSYVGPASGFNRNVGYSLRLVK